MLFVSIMRNSLKMRPLGRNKKRNSEKKKIILTKSHMGSPLKAPNELASEYESAIKSALVAEFALVPDTLHLLLEDEDGAYWSREESGTLCVLVLGQENGHLYLVTGRWDEEQGCLRDFKCGMLG